MNFDALIAYSPFVFPIVILALIGYQLKIGETVRMRFIPSVSRSSHKIGYWSVLAFQAILGGYATYDRFEAMNTADSTAVASVQTASMTGGAVKQASKPAPPPPTPVNAKFRDSALALHRARKFALAAAMYDSALGANPGDPELVYWRGVANWNAPNRIPEALRDFRKTIELDPANWNAHLNADRILVADKKFDESIALWNKYLERVPNNADALLERSGTFRLKGDTASARADAAKACELGKREACPPVARAAGATKAR